VAGEILLPVEGRPEVDVAETLGRRTQPLARYLCIRSEYDVPLGVPIGVREGTSLSTLQELVQQIGTRRGCF
jgi:hypothetical protein